MTLPNFLIIGGQRSGTTSLPNVIIPGLERSATTTLHYTLAAHPQILVSSRKEPNFWLFDEDGAPPRGMAPRQARLMEKRSGKTMQDYLALFASAGPNHLALVDVSPAYCRFADTVAPRIADALPHAKVAIMLRHPVDHARSLLATWLGRPPTTHELCRALDDNLPEPAGGPGLREHGQSYAECLRPFFLSVQPNQIRAFLFDRLKVDLLDDLQRFIGVDRMPLKLRHYNQSGRSVISNGGRRWLTTAKGLARAALPGSMQRLLLPIGHRLRSGCLSTTAPTISAEMRAALVERFYRDMIFEVEELAGLDLTAWRCGLPGRRSSSSALPSRASRGG